MNDATDAAAFHETLRLTTQGAGDASDSPITRALQVIRRHLGMDVAYASEFVGGQSVYRAVDAPGLEHLIKPGDSRSLDDVYCRHILAGRLPELIPDTADEPLAQTMPITHAVPIGAHVSVPIRLSSGECYGMFCCLSATPDRSLNKRDLQAMYAFADVVGFEVERDLTAKRDAEAQMARVERLLDGPRLSAVYQPIQDIQQDRVVGFEALTRFDAEPHQRPDQWFAEATTIGKGLAIELAALTTALRGLASLPAGTFLSLNASPETAMSDELSAALQAFPVERIVLELTERAPVDDYGRLRAALAPLREKGLRVAIDDAGAGYASLHHITELEPDLIKCDMSLTRGIDGDPVLRALMRSLIGFARETGSIILAEGIETASELDCLRRLGTELGQGYHLGKPEPRLRCDGLRSALPLLESVRIAS